MPRIVPPTPPWTYCFRLDLAHVVRRDAYSLEQHKLLRKVLSSYPDSSVYYTDGSKTSLSVGCAVYSAGSFTLPEVATVYTAELTGILKAVQWHLDIVSSSTCIICTDSLSAGYALRDQFAYDPMTVAVWECVKALRLKGCRTVFVWIPGHIDIAGNEAAEAAAKETSGTPEPPDRLPVRMEDLKCQIRRMVWERWQDQWSATPSKLGLVKRSVRPWSSECDLSRKDQVIMTRLRLGHTRISLRDKR